MNNQENEKESIGYDLSEGRLIAEVKNMSCSGWRVFRRSFTLMEDGPNGKISLPCLLPDTQIELQMTLTDCTNETESLINVRINEYEEDTHNARH